MSLIVSQGESAEQRVLVAILHPAGEPGRGHSAAEGAQLADIFPVRDPGNCARPGGRGSGEAMSHVSSVTCLVTGASAVTRPARLPVQLTRVPPGAKWTHVVSQEEIKGMQ